MKRFRKNVSVEVNQDVDVTIDSGVVKDFLESCSLDELNEILTAINHPALPDMPVKTINDALKFEVLANAFKKYSIFELEEKLK